MGQARTLTLQAVDARLHSRATPLILLQILSSCLKNPLSFPLHFRPSGLFVADFDLFVAFFYFFLCVLGRRPYQKLR
jgi:hypothetical protein